MFSAQNPKAEYYIIKLLKALMVLMYWLGRKKNANKSVVERAVLKKKLVDGY
jgi:hypothetical protein